MTETEPPPAYRETGTETDQDGPLPATEKPDAPAPDGEGILKSPLKRMMYIGITLLLYFILSFWMPVYWLTAAANFCPFTCNNFPGASTASSYSVGTSYDYYDTDVSSYSSSYSFTGGSSGCYESTDPLCESACLESCAICEDIPICKDALPDIYESVYLTSGHSARLVSFILTVMAMSFGFIGCILGYFAVKNGNHLYSQIATGLLALAGVMIIVGAIIFMATWHESLDFEEMLAAYQLLVFIEWLLPAIICIVLAVDVYNPYVLNDENKRMMALTLPFAVLGLTAGILMSYIINYEPDGAIAYEHPLYGEGGCIAAGYFIVSLMAIARILVYGQHVKVSDNPASVITAKFAMTVVMCIGAIILAIGYWAYIDAIFDCEAVYSTLTGTYTIQCEGIYTLLYLNGDYTSTYWGTTVDVPYTGQFKSYYVGYSFFILLITAINAYDMDIQGTYATVRAAQQAASAAS